MLSGLHEQGGVHLLARQTVSLWPTVSLPGSVLSLTRPEPTNTNTNTDSGSTTASSSSSSLTSTGTSPASATSSSSSPSLTSIGTSPTPTVSSTSFTLPTSASPIPTVSSSTTPSTSLTAQSTSTTPATSTPTSSSPNSSPGSSTSPIATSAPMASTTEASTTSSPSATGVVVVASHVKTGAIVGGVIGGVAFVLLVIGGILLYLRMRRQAPSRSRRRSMGELDSSRPAGYWTGLSSRDNTVLAVADSKPPRAHHRSHSQPQADAVGMIAVPDSGSVEYSKYRRPSDEDMVSLGEEVKFNQPEYVQAVPPLDYVPPSVPGSSEGGHRRASVGSSTRAVALAKLDTAAANASSSPGHSRQRSIGRAAYAGSPSTPSTASHAQGTPTSPLSPAPAEPMSRSASASASAGSSRRPAARKPVPSYHSSVSAGSSATEKRHSTSSTPTPSHGLTPAHSREDLSGARRFNVPDLSHKSSFGEGRAMHYLVPDLPPAVVRK